MVGHVVVAGVDAAAVRSLPQRLPYAALGQVGRDHRQRPPFPPGVAEVPQVLPDGRVRAVRLHRAVQATVGGPRRPVRRREVVQPAGARHADRGPAHDVPQPVEVVAALGEHAGSRPVRPAPVAAHV